MKVRHTKHMTIWENETCKKILWDDGEIWFFYYENGKTKSLNIQNPEGGYEWLNNDNLWHRHDGPAIESSEAGREFWYVGKRYTFYEWLEIIEKHHGEKHAAVMKLKWADLSKHSYKKTSGVGFGIASIDTDWDG